MRVLILGQGGFLGRHVQAALSLQRDFRVIPGPRSQDTDLARAGAEPWQRLLGGAQPQVVVNCAGRIQGSPDELRRANLTLVERLLEAARAGRSRPWIVHLGSAAEYGAQPGRVAEDSPTAPTSPYGESKLAATHALLEAYPALPVTVLRVGNPLGRGQSPQTLIGRAAEQFRLALRHGLPQVEFGDLSAERDFIDARDVARAVVATLRGRPTEPLLNVGRGEPVSARSLVHELARLCQYSGQIAEQPGGSSRSTAVAWQVADITRLRRLDWAPAYSLQDALCAVWRGARDPGARPTPPDLSPTASRQAVA